MKRRKVWWWVLSNFRHAGMTRSSTISKLSNSHHKRRRISVSVASVLLFLSTFSLVVSALLLMLAWRSDSSSTSTSSSSSSSSWNGPPPPEKRTKIRVLKLPRGPLVPEPNFVPRNLRLCFLGDSITRYQYIDLMHYLHFGEWYSAPPSYDWDDYLTRSWSFGLTFNEYFVRTNELFAPYEQCDCRRETEAQMELAEVLLRNGTAKRGQKVFLQKHPDPRNWYENRFYWNPETNNSVSYIQAFGDYGAASHWKPQTAFAPGHKPVKGGQKPFFRGNWPETIANFIAKLDPKPDVLVFNSGRWPSYEFAADVNLDRVLEAIQKTGIRAIWKTTTPSKIMEYFFEDYEERLCAALPCLNLNWTLDLPWDAQWDPVHFWNQYYTTMNKQLLALLDQRGWLPLQPQVPSDEPLFLPPLTDPPTPAPTAKPTTKWYRNERNRKRRKGGGGGGKNQKQKKPANKKQGGQQRKQGTNKKKKKKQPPKTS